MAKSPKVKAPRFAEQARVVLPGSEKAAAENAVHVKATPAKAQLTVSLIVKRKEPLKINSRGGRANGPVRLSRAEYKKHHSADPDALKLVKAFGREFNLKVGADPSAAIRRTVQLTGAAADIKKAFGVELNQKSIDGVEYRVREGGIHLPESLGGSVLAVLGLDNRPQANPHFRVRRVKPEAGLDPAAAPSSYTPPEVAQAYQWPASATGAGETIGIIELGGGYRQTDLTAYFKTLGLAAPAITAVSVDKGKNAPSNASGADGEVMLDIEVAASVAPGVKIVVYFTPNTDQGFTDAITTAVHDTTNNPSVISISWGGPESSWTSQAMTALDAACQSAAALGVTITVAAGDNGSTDGATGNNVDFPASSPHVLACGGTKLDAHGSTLVSEVVWNELANNDGATGGGVSNQFPLPSWQADANVPGSAASSGGRGVPDVSGDADPNTGYTIRVDGQTTVIGGTSAVAPLWAGLIAVANRQLGTKVGFIQPAIYAAKAAAAFNDITEGNNGAFSAAPGWDACTGLGSPKASALIPLLAPAGTIPTPAPTPPPKKKKKKESAKTKPVEKKAGKKASIKKAAKKTSKKKAAKKSSGNRRKK
jgi:kumamolisin